MQRVLNARFSHNTDHLQECPRPDPTDIPGSSARAPEPHPAVLVPESNSLLRRTVAATDPCEVRQDRRGLRCLTISRRNRAASRSSQLTGRNLLKLLLRSTRSDSSQALPRQALLLIASVKISKLLTDMEGSAVFWQGCLNASAQAKSPQCHAVQGCD